MQKYIPTLLLFFVVPQLITAQSKKRNHLQPSYLVTEVQKEMQPIDYCKKIDSLIDARYFNKISNYVEGDRLRREIETESGLYGTYSLGFSGMIYCDTFFNSDVRRWSKHFNCDAKILPPAPQIIPTPCDTTKFELTD